MELLDFQPLEGYHPEVGLLLGALRDSTREWRLHLGEVSEEALRWQGPPPGYSVGMLLLHIIDVEDFWLRVFVGGQPRTEEESALYLSEETDQYEGVWPTPPEKPLSWYFDLHDQVRGRAFEALRGMDPDRTFERPGRGRSYTLRWIVAHVLQHDSYTGGQAVALHEMWKRKDIL